MRVGVMEVEAGSFFFFSKDKSIIIKTIPEIELNKLLSNLKKYHEHFKTYPDTYIAKVLGVYTFERGDSSGEKVNLIMMKNLCGFPSRFVERTYDMKGSRFDRQVIKGEQIEKATPEMLRGQVLKDLDFEQFEKHMFVENRAGNKIVEQLKSDVDFLCSCKLIDYSLILFKINIGKYESEKKANEESIQLFKDIDISKKIIASNKAGEEGVIYYRLGIIDYLQPYNLKKKVEKWWKKISKRNLSLDTSTQDPQTYARRFNMNLVDKLTPCVESSEIRVGEMFSNRGLSAIQLENA